MGYSPIAMARNAIGMAIVCEKYGAKFFANGANTLICQSDKDGITIFCHDGRTVKISAEDGFVGYTANGEKIYWTSESNFHMKKSVVEDEITIAHRLRFIPIDTDTNHGIGIVAMV